MTTSSLQLATWKAVQWRPTSFCEGYLQTRSLISGKLGWPPELLIPQHKRVQCTCLHQAVPSFLEAHTEPAGSSVESPRSLGTNGAPTSPMVAPLSPQGSMSTTMLLKPVEQDLQQLDENLRRLISEENPLLMAAADQIFGVSGKKIRPALVFLVSYATAQLTGLRDITPQHRKLAEIIEMIHTASLIHDDVLDESDKRRATLAWPVPAVVQLGIILSTLGAALQSLTGAPRLLAAIANDDILPVLKYFKAPDSVEPHAATLFTMLICGGCVCIGNLDLITPVITMFFLMCYGGVNLSCFLLDLLDAPSWRPRWKFHHWSLSLVGALVCLVIMFLISWSFTVVSLALASLLYYYVSVKGKGGDWGDGFKSAYFQLALRSLRTLGANQVHPKNWYPIPLVFCRPWGSLPQDVPCHPKLADFANCMKKKGRGMSIFLSIIDGEYREKAEEARHACKLLSTYIDYKNCEGVGEIVVAKNMHEGFRGVVQTMGLGNLKPNIVVMRYPEIWREENASEIPQNFVSIIDDCITANKAVVIVKGLDEWPGEFQKQYGTIDLYWIVRDGGLMLLLSQLLRSKESFESCKIRVFCISEEDTSAEELKADVRKFLYDLRMQAEVIVVTMKSWEAYQEDQEAKMGKEDAMEAFSKARKRLNDEAAKLRKSGHMRDNEVAVSDQQVNKFLYTTLTLNSIILRYSRIAAVVLVSLPPPPSHHPACFYMEYMDLLVESVPRLLVVRGYRRDVVTIFT